ncbi:hypothetical protein CLV80_11055 [Yoonia maritima]|uniref:Uncharacterized protein n=1 Tax=Yoonia maritima TaxID=1435347 RepID=A0A2T0VW75_9RHOB|nr:hypothetical protein CLV80_11055 [Yoonia maritima]
MFLFLFYFATLMPLIVCLGGVVCRVDELHIGCLVPFEKADFDHENGDQCDRKQFLKMVQAAPIGQFCAAPNETKTNSVRSCDAQSLGAITKLVRTHNCETKYF